RTGKTFQLIAASGVEGIERRSETVQRLQALVTAILSLNRPYWIMEADEKYPPQIATPLHAYLDLAGLRSLMIFPLSHIIQETSDDSAESQSEVDTSQLTVGAIVMEQFQEAP
ncbi:MAG TPA: hypothetical protein DCM07_02355, partial [Planctomycetaceae bacterium]|nr:hypothetical protein [Planctomycetaceae bacterium]